MRTGKENIKQGLNKGKRKQTNAKINKNKEYKENIKQGLNKGKRKQTNAKINKNKEYKEKFLQ